MFLFHGEFFRSNERGRGSKLSSSPFKFQTLSSGNLSPVLKYLGWKRVTVVFLLHGHSLLDGDEFHVEDQSGVGRNRSGPPLCPGSLSPCAISEFGRDEELPFVAFLHQLPKAWRYFLFCWKMDLYFSSMTAAVSFVWQ